MSQLLARILDDVKIAMKAGERSKLEALRTLHADIKKIAIDSKKDITDDMVIDVLSKTIKQKRDAITQFAAGGRQDLVDEENSRIGLFEGYLPAQLSAEELNALISAAVAESGASGPSDMGKVMKILAPQVKGKADGKAVSAAVSARLSGH